MKRKQKTKKCPTCKGKGRIKVDFAGLTKEQNKFVIEKCKDLWD